MRFQNRSNLPPHLVSILTAAWKASNESYLAGRPTGEKIISVTELIGPAQKRRLERQHADELEMDILDAVPSLFGSALHHVLEQAGQNATQHIPEERMSTMFDTWTITGKSDLYTTEDGRLIDFKTGSVWSYVFGKQEWVDQLNVLRWIRVRNGGVVKSLEIDLFPKDWRRGEAKKDPGRYPGQVVVIPIPMWSMDEAERYVARRLAIHGAAVAPPCSPEERWERPSAFAVKKRGVKKAVRVYDNFAEADDHAAGVTGLYVEPRPGQSTRCLGYCSAAPFCNTWKADPTNPMNTKENDA